MTNPKTPIQLAEEYLNRFTEANPRQFPELSSSDVVEAYYQGYTTRDQEVQELKQQIAKLDEALIKANLRGWGSF